MRTSLIAVLALGITLPGALAGGGTVTSIQPGPKTLTVDATSKMLDTMSIAAASAPEPVAITAPAVTITHVSPPLAPLEKKAEAEKPKKIEVAETSAPLTPRETVQQCATCHGYDGLARIPTAPNIAGSSRQYLETQLKAFRSGKRENEVMAVIAKDLTNAEIKTAAKWYASLKVTVEGSE